MRATAADSGDVAGHGSPRVLSLAAPRTRNARLRVWLDIENPPQVQYLLPFKAAFEATGAEVVVTARDYGSTIEMLRQSGTPASVFGTKVGRGRARKGAAAIARARGLLRLFAGDRRPDVLLAASRASGLAAWRLRVPTFMIGDYEYASATVSRLTGLTLLYPDVIKREFLLARGLRPHQLVPFRGLKEDLTFAGVDVDAVEPYDLHLEGNAVRVLFRPPSETSHYSRKASTQLARATLVHLAREGAFVIFAPREPGQVRLLDGLPFAYDPVILRESVPFVSLLKSVDAVVCAGGTMLREAAYLGIPAYSIFQSEIAAVDHWLEKIGRACLLRGPHELGRIELKPRTSIERLDSNPNLLNELVEIVAKGATSRAREASHK